MTRSKSTDPNDYMGIYKRLADVPDRYRLSQHAAAYNGRNVWQDYLDDSLFDRLQSDRSRRDARRVGQDWQDHTSTRGRHHALATPEDVETWFADLLDRLALETVYTHRYVWLEGFFSWLQSHTDHPHVYHPVWMAAADDGGDATGSLWEYKIHRTRAEGDGGGTA
jgi:hypothetical protein